MKTLLIGFLVLSSTFVYAEDAIINAVRNCDISLNIDKELIANNKSTLERIFKEKNFVSNFKQVEWDEFPLRNEFLLSITSKDERVLKEVELRLYQDNNGLGSGSKLVFKEKARTLSRTKALRKLLETLPNCVNH